MIEITTIYFVWLLRIFQPYLILSIENLLSTKPLLNLPIVNRYTSFDVINFIQVLYKSVKLIDDLTNLDSFDWWVYIIILETMFYLSDVRLKPSIKLELLKAKLHLSEHTSYLLI